MSKRKEVLVTAAIIAVVVIGAAGVWIHHIVAFGAGAARDLGQATTRLLCETDHQALLNACRELSHKSKPDN